MERVDVAELLRRYVADGFPLDVLSKVTGIQQDTLVAVSTGEPRWFTGVDSNCCSYLIILLCQLYLCTPESPNYYGELVDSLTSYFSIPFGVVANYVGATESDLKQFLHAPSKHKKRIEYGERILHLFLQFSRNPRFSFEQI